MKQQPVKIRELEAKVRANNFEEVALGYNEEEALQEANRCIQCKNPTCIDDCPVGIDIKKFIAQITEKDYRGAYLKIREKNDLPSICGRICPAEYQCRKACVFSKKGLPFASKEAINIHFLERFIGDYGINNNLEIPTQKGGKFSKFKLRLSLSGSETSNCKVNCSFSLTLIASLLTLILGARLFFKTVS